ncbi:aspartate dehydrogenase [Pusillimonas sp. CC-YST705]|uniref:L-aspartate dehydrogenase n=1 Tax=Mesopusillimonas faecipullorum TaxID=2755040 RepID=A0ABS8CAT8_9BURK|nr:aspartate dehydrogenase [Mesopusillimonas faecipullorum]MCB5363128.1 aspartate dehydrogenase [Mesopusillimonas faecipullorum]
MQRIAMIGFGAIGRAVIEAIREEPRLKLVQLIATPGKVSEVQAQLATLGLSEPPLVSESLILDGSCPVDCVVECAGHAAIQEHVLPALQEGLPCVLVSIGALSEPGLAEALEMAAGQGNTQLHLLSGAIGGIDALAAARIAGLEEVVYTGRKPPMGWLGSPAEETLDLAALTQAEVFFEGTARDAAQQFPKNANVAATLALAGIGLDRTRVRLIADPEVTENIHHYQARGAFGRMEVTMVGKPLASNPKTSALTVYSVVRALCNRVRSITV